jgi:hypothetical protein
MTSRTGEHENRVTYPRFFRGPENTFIYTYRDGQSGKGNQIYNRFDYTTDSWVRLLDTPLVDGEGQRNAYLNGPILGPNGFYHLCWVWRDTPDCATNHTLSYARSRDLRQWESGAGKSIPLPITLNTADIVDPVPPGGGMINGNTDLGFDASQRAVITYHKHDAEGNTQIYNARLEDGAWKIYQQTHWDYRWEFSGGGSIHFEIRVSPVSVDKEFDLTQVWSHDKFGKERWRLDPDTLVPIEKIPLPDSPLPSGMGKPVSDFPGISVKWASDSGESGENGIRYWLRWETLGPNRDRPREKPWPPASTLELVRVVD